MSSFDEKSRELISKAENGDWSLACDEKMLELMQNVASKIENRSATTKSSISTMMLNLDETKVRLSNLTRINSIKNSNYCENLIKDDHLDQEPEVESRDQDRPVKLPTQIAIENGMKLLEHCFEKHRVNLDPSSERSETSTVYRPIDKYMNVLPHLIGSDKWKEKWHVGLLDSDINSHAESEQYAESIDSNTAQTSNCQPEMDEPIMPGSSLMSSQELAQSVSSFGDHMVINQPGGLFDEDEHGSFLPATSSNGPVHPFFQQQPEQRKIVNLFDDEPPSLEPSPVASRKAENLFEEDDYSSVQSFPAETLESIVKNQQPVDLFNDSEFDDFIRKIEQQPSASQENKKSEPVNNEVKKALDMKKISEEIKQVQLKKTQKDVPKMSENVPVPKVQPTVAKKVEAKPKESEAPQVFASPVVQVKRVEPTPPPVQSEPEVKANKPKLKNITNLFDDDDDDQDDYFSQIIKQKAASKTNESVVPKAHSKLKSANLFEDEDENESFYKDKVEVVEPPVVKKTVSLLFDDEDDELPEISIAQKPTTVVTKKASNLFDDEDDSIVFEEKREVPKVIEKPKVPDPPVFEDKVVTEESKKSFDDAPKHLPRQESENKENLTVAVDEVDREAPKEIELIVDIIDDFLPPEDIRKLSDDPASSLVAAETSVPHSTPNTSFNTTLPFLCDEPPDDDSWDTEDNFEEQPEIVANKSALNYSSIQLFDDVPPDDDFMPASKDLSVHNDEIENYSDEFESNIPSKKNNEPQSQQAGNADFKDLALPGPLPQDLLDEKTTSKIKAEETIVPKPLINETLATGSIKSKLESFVKKAEEAPTVQQAKKPLPGKLSSNLKINVGALMPGARYPSRDSVERAVDISNEPNGSAVIDPNNNNDNPNLLNNDAAKSRAKIQVKRRPSTRRGRQSNYQKALSAHLSEEEAEEKSEFTAEAVETAKPPLTKNLAASIFDDMDDDGEEFAFSSTSQSQNNPLIFDDQPPPDDPIPKTVTTNKISVFYDDEDDTRLLVEARKRQQQASNELKTKNVSAVLFDDLGEETLASNVPAVNVVEKEKPKETRTAFYDESDDDLFGGRSSSKPEPKVVSNPIPPKPVEAKLKTTASLFDDDEDDGLFGGQTDRIKTTAKKVTKLFESDDDESETNGSIIFPKRKPGQPKKQSIFGDDESDGDDLFSSKPKSSTIKATTSTVKPTAIVKKQSTQAVDDPLKDLLN